MYVCVSYIRTLHARKCQSFIRHIAEGLLMFAIQTPVMYVWHTTIDNQQTILYTTYIETVKHSLCTMYIDEQEEDDSNSLAKQFRAKSFVHMQVLKYQVLQALVAVWCPHLQLSEQISCRVVPV